MEQINIHPNVTYIERGIILPRKIDNTSNSWGIGGVCTENGCFCEDSVYDGGWIKFGGSYPIEKVPKRVNKKVIFLGYFFEHWGHFLIDQNTRSWYIAENDCSDYLVAFLGDSLPSGNYAEFYKYLGIRPEQMILVNELLQFDQVVLPANSARPCKWFSPAWVNTFEKVAKTAIEIKSLSGIPDNSFENYYFSRINLNKSRRDEFGEKYIVNRFQANDWGIISPECLTLGDQIYILNSSKKFAAINGSIPLNLLFLINASTNIYVFNKCSFDHANLKFVAFAKGLAYKSSDIYFEYLKKYPRGLGDGPFLINNYRSFNEFAKYELSFDTNNPISAIYNYADSFIKYLNEIYIRRKLQKSWHYIRKCMQTRG